jgi:hypothetical protein
VPTSTGTPNSCRWCNIIQNARTVASRRLAPYCEQAKSSDIPQHMDGRVPRGCGNGGCMARPPPMCSRQLDIPGGWACTLGQLCSAQNRLARFQPANPASSWIRYRARLVLTAGADLWPLASRRSRSVWSESPATKRANMRPLCKALGHRPRTSMRRFYSAPAASRRFVADPRDPLRAVRPSSSRCRWAVERGCATAIADPPSKLQPCKAEYGWGGYQAS